MLAAVGQADRAADAERALQQPRHAAHHRRQDSPVEQQRGQHAHDQHDRQRLKRQDEIRARRLEVERQRAAAEIAEHEGGAGAGGGGDRADRVIDGAEGVRDQRQLCQDHRGEKSDGKADGGLPQRHRAAVFAKRPGDRQQREHAKRRLQLQHDLPRVPGRLWQEGLLRSAMLYPINASAPALTIALFTASSSPSRGRRLTCRDEAGEPCRP